MKRALSALALSTLAALSGCTFLNAPDRTIEPVSPTDGSAPDADAGMRTDGDVCPMLENVCQGGVDEDCDGFTDCADFDCAGEFACCAGSALFFRTMPAEWSTSIGSKTSGRAWHVVPAGETLPTPSVQGIESFGPDNSVRAVIHDACAPIAVGARIATVLTAFDPGACAGMDAGECDRFAGIVLTHQTSLKAGSRLPADLGVFVTADGILRVEQAGALLGTTHVESTQTTVTIDLGPGLDEVGNAAITAEVSTGAGGVVLARRPIVLERDLLVAPGCDPIAGLYVAIEGRGAGVRVGETSATLLQCANPSHFDSAGGASATITSETMGLDSWASGGIAAPAAVGYMSASTVDWQFAADASNLERELELSRYVPFSIGRGLYHQATNTWESLTGTPAVGADPPWCSVEPCPSPRSAREPSLYMDGRDGSNFLAAYAWQVPATAKDPIQFALHVVTGNSDASGSFDMGDPALSPAGPCQSLRDPNVVPAPPGSTRGATWWLFFTCEPGDSPRQIHMVALDASRHPIGEPMSVLPLEDLGAYATGGVRAPEVVASLATAAPFVYRMWFVARDAVGVASIAMAQAEVQDPDDIPSFAPYPANPVLTRTSPSMATCANCDLLGLAVSRRPDADATLRFFVARRVNTLPASEGHQLIGLDQFWRSD